MEIMIDTNFILACVENKADFFDLENYGKIIIAREVVDELEKIKEDGDLKDRINSEIALKIILKNKDKFKVIDFEETFVDKGILDYVAKNKNVAVATLDKDLRKKLKGKTEIINLEARKKFRFL